MVRQWPGPRRRHFVSIETDTDIGWPRVVDLPVDELVLGAFAGGTGVAEHVNGDVTDNALSNLRWKR